MKKIYSIITAIFILTSVFTISTTSKEIIDFSDKTEKRSEIPKWADGNFSGEWGENFFGLPGDPLGWVEGYYEISVISRIEANYAKYDEEKVFNFSAIVIGSIFMFGRIWEEGTNNGTVFVGLGGVNNETKEFYFRLMGIIGPNYYMKGTCTEFIANEN